METCPLLLRDGFQIATFEVFHHQEDAVSDLVGVNHPHNVRMIEAGGKRDFPLETSSGNVIIAQVGRHHLECNQPAERSTLSFENGSHAALAEHIHQFVAAQEQFTFARQQLPGLPFP